MAVTTSVGDPAGTSGRIWSLTVAFCDVYPVGITNFIWKKELYHYQKGGEPRGCANPG